MYFYLIILFWKEMKVKLIPNTYFECNPYTITQIYVYLFCVDFILNRICITRLIKIMSISFSRTYRYLFPLFPISFRHIEFRGDNLWIFVHLPDSFNIYAWLAQIIHFNTIIVSSFETNKSLRYQLSKIFEVCVFVYLRSFEKC